MRYIVIVKPNAKENVVEVLEPGMFRISVTAPATEDKANLAMLKLLAKHLALAPSNLRIKYGAKTRRKIVEVTE